MRCVKQTGRESSERVYVYKKPGLECWVDKIQQSFSPEFLADLKNPKYKLQLWDGSSLTQSELQQQLLDNVRTYSSPDYPGFVKERESDGIVYERNPSLEKEGNAFLSKDVVHRILIRTCMCSICFCFCWKKNTCFQYLNLNLSCVKKNSLFLEVFPPRGGLEDSS